VLELVVRVTDREDGEPLLGVQLMPTLIGHGTSIRTPPAGKIAGAAIP
jgi:hypothetical protein